MTGLDEQRARDFWIKQAAVEDPVIAVNPGARSAGVQSWTRRMLQTWTLGRMRAMQPRFRRCVDIGCGYGDWTEQFATLADEVHGCELAPAFVEQARRRVPGAAIECCDLRAYAVPVNADFVYMGAVLLRIRGRCARRAPSRACSRGAWCARDVARLLYVQSRPAHDQSQ